MSYSSLLIAIILAFTSMNASAESPPVLRLAITHTTDNSGLMSQLNPAFESHTGIRVNTITAGSGHALRLGQEGNVDVLLTHAPAAERVFINEGHGIKRSPVMHNDFIIVGPVADPAAVATATSAEQAFAAIAKQQQPFISRADQSGTHMAELAFWQGVGIEPAGRWYVASGVNMGQALMLASNQGAYTLTDRGTFLAYRARLGLVMLFESPMTMLNPYHVIAVNPDNHANVQPLLAQKYIEFITGPIGQGVINDFRVGGERLFHPANAKPESAAETSVQQVRGSFFLDALLSSFRLIIALDKELYYVVWTSLKVSLLAVLFAALISIPLGVMVALNTFRGKHFLLACLNTLMALPTVVVGLLMYGLLNRQGLFGDYGLLYTPAAIIVGQCVLIIPVVWNLSIAAINGADPRLAKTCSSLGASFFQRCIIYMSEVRFALIAAIVTGFGRAIGEVGIAMMLGGNIAGYTRTMTTAIALETSKGEFEFALALGFMLLLVAFVVNGVLQRFQLRAR